MSSFILHSVGSSLSTLGKLGNSQNLKWFSSCHQLFQITKNASSSSSSSSSSNPIINKILASNSTTNPHYRIAIIGGGPSGFYVAHHLFKNKPDIHIDIFEKLHMPFGLVRYGVAPDHPEVKNVTNQFESILANPHCNYFGNVNVGQNISVEELKKYYSALVFTYGAESDRRLNIPQEDPPLLSLSNKENPNATATEQEMEKLTAQSGGVISARSFVGWYNGHPEHHSLNPDLTRGDTAVIFGHGNVSLDIARMLLSPLELLKTTDISNTALTALKTSKIKKVILIGRRGPIEVSFTIKELREMTKLPGCVPDLAKEDFNFTEEEKQFYQKERPRKRLTELLISTANNNYNNNNNKASPITSTTTVPAITASENVWKLAFKQSPHEIERDEKGNVTGVHVIINKLVGPINSRQAVPTQQTVFYPCSLVIRSIGYQSLPMKGVPFDTTKKRIPNVAGRVVAASNSNSSSDSKVTIDNVEVLKGVYCSGWVKHGPIGIIATTMTDSFATGSKILEDITNNVIQPVSLAVSEGNNQQQQQQQQQQLSSDLIVDYPTFLKLNKFELEKGQLENKPRLKLESKEDIQTALQNM